MMKKLFLLLVSAALPALCGCASFNSGDLKVERGTARAMLTDTSITPFSGLEVYWQNFPYRSPTDSIGEGSISNPKVRKPEPVLPEEILGLSSRAKKIFGKAGLYNRRKGRGTLRLTLTSLGRWTYGDLFRSYLVETGFIFILPSTLQVNYLLTADFAVSSGTVRIETEGRNRTTFHLLMAPLFPFSPPGRRETGLINQMLWRSAADVYTKLKTAGGPAEALPPPEEEVLKHTIPGPPLAPDRTWLPGKEDGSPEVRPEAPDKTWVVPAAGSKAPQQQEVNPYPPDRALETKPATNNTVQAAPAAKTAAPVSGETPDN
jgi:hypothetical protein